MEGLDFLYYPWIHFPENVYETDTLAKYDKAHRKIGPIHAAWRDFWPQTGNPSQLGMP